MIGNDIVKNIMVDILRDSSKMKNIFEEGQVKKWDELIYYIKILL